MRNDKFRFSNISHPLRPGTFAFGVERSSGWALGLRHLYDGVVEESVPADLDDLVARIQGSGPRGS